MNFQETIYKSFRKYQKHILNDVATSIANPDLEISDVYEISNRCQSEFVGSSNFILTLNLDNRNNPDFSSFDADTHHSLFIETLEAIHDLVEKRVNELRAELRASKGVM